MKVYITKYALSKGIFEQEVEEHEASPNYYFMLLPRGQAYLIKKEHTAKTIQDALAAAEKIREKEIERATEKLKQLKEMKIKVSEFISGKFIAA